MLQLLIAVHASEQLDVKEDPAPTLPQVQDFEVRLGATKLRPAVQPERWVLPADSASATATGASTPHTP